MQHEYKVGDRIRYKDEVADLWDGDDEIVRLDSSGDPVTARYGAFFKRTLRDASDLLTDDTTQEITAKGHKIDLEQMVKAAKKLNEATGGWKENPHIRTGVDYGYDNGSFITLTNDQYDRLLRRTVPARQWHKLAVLTLAMSFLGTMAALLVFLAVVTKI